MRPRVCAPAGDGVRRGVPGTPDPGGLSAPARWPSRRTPGRRWPSGVAVRRIDVRDGNSAMAGVRPRPRRSWPSMSVAMACRPRVATAPAVMATGHLASVTSCPVTRAVAAQPWPPADTPAVVRRPRVAAPVSGRRRGHVGQGRDPVHQGPGHAHPAGHRRAGYDQVSDRTGPARTWARRGGPIRAAVTTPLAAYVPARGVPLLPRARPGAYGYAVCGAAQPSHAPRPGGRPPP